MYKVKSKEMDEKSLKMLKYKRNFIGVIVIVFSNGDDDDDGGVGWWLVVVEKCTQKSAFTVRRHASVCRKFRFVAVAMGGCGLASKVSTFNQTNQNTIKLNVRKILKKQVKESGWKKKRKIIDQKQRLNIRKAQNLFFEQNAENFNLNRVRRKGKNRPVSFHLIDLRIHHYHHHHHHQRCRRRRCLPLTSSKRRNFDIRSLRIHSTITMLEISVLINFFNDAIVNVMFKEDAQNFADSSKISRHKVTLRQQ
ncbi:hypothetical protein T11_5962 [Trichinella zimbabwensis]|uniref:Uncharacterized protein n=1 Tax=Trichinella zimbabwensis TaxID=268475 RepID=A0A0V1I6B4_9BILA|nr:hypothetical protein T11_5962 [Trichinella zimbabwensis]